MDSQTPNSFRFTFMEAHSKTMVDILVHKCSCYVCTTGQVNGACQNKKEIPLMQNEIYLRKRAGLEGLKSLSSRNTKAGSEGLKSPATCLTHSSTALPCLMGDPRRHCRTLPLRASNPLAFPPSSSRMKGAIHPATLICDRNRPV